MHSNSVLVVEDDPGLGTHFEKAPDREGFSCTPRPAIVRGMELKAITRRFSSITWGETIHDLNRSRQRQTLLGHFGRAELSAFSRAWQIRYLLSPAYDRARNPESH